jgi:uncharacterized protein
MDLTPIIAADRQVIEAYGTQGFRVSGVAYAGAVIVFPDATVPWRASTMADVSAESLAAVTARAGGANAVEILLLGCGKQLRAVPRPLREALRAAGTVIDPMDTGAACRTYDVLLGEGRRVAAALLPA